MSNIHRKTPTLKSLFRTPPVAVSADDSGPPEKLLKKRMVTNKFMVFGQKKFRTIITSFLWEYTSDLFGF